MTTQTNESLINCAHIQRHDFHFAGLQNIFAAGNQSELELIDDLLAYFENNETVLENITKKVKCSKKVTDNRSAERPVRRRMGPMSVKELTRRVEIQM